MKSFMREVQEIRHEVLGTPKAISVPSMFINKDASIVNLLDFAVADGTPEDFTAVQTAIEARDRLAKLADGTFQPGESIQQWRDAQRERELAEIAIRSS